jgi:membrane protease YdiL (CAAX protease family)
MIEFIRERLAEPGTARSIAVVLFALAGGGNSEAAWEAAIYVVIAILGAWSALRPESK